jgi:ribosome maturation factor RimP
MNHPTRRTPLPHPLVTDLERLVAPQAVAAALRLEAVHLHTHRIPMTVQVLVRRADGSDVSLDDCAAFSGPLAEALEAAALLEAPYVLEVSSPGIGEELSTDRDFISFRSFPVAVDRLAADGSETVQEGLLLGRDAEAVQLNVRGRTVRLPRQEVVRVRLVSPRDGP